MHTTRSLTPYTIITYYRAFKNFEEIAVSINSLSE